MARDFKPYPMPKAKPMKGGEPDKDDKGAKGMPKRMGSKGCPKR
jgi:hypothetical protein